MARAVLPASPPRPAHPATGTAAARPASPAAPVLLRGVGLLVAGAAILPLVYLCVRAWESGDYGRAVLLRPRTLELFVNTAVLALAVTFAATAIAVPFAWLTTRADLPLRRFWGVAGVLPLVVPSYVGAFTMIAAFGPKGIMQQFLVGPFGVERLPEVYGFAGAWLTLTLFTYPYILLQVRAAMQRLDPSVEEAARGLAHDERAVFFRVVLPQLWPAISGGGLLVALTGAVLLLDVATRRRARYHRVGGGGSPRPPRRVALGRWRVPGVLFCGGTVALALGMPVGVLVYWFAAGLRRGDFGTVAVSAWNSLWVSAAAAALALALAVPVAVLATRFPSRFSRLVERLTYMEYALPGLVVALALVFFGARYVPVLYQTAAMLLAAYTLRYLPQAVGAVRTSLVQVNPHLEEASRSLGHGRRFTLWHVTLPLIRPGVLAGAGLVFLMVMKELPATLLLGPVGFKTLATTLWTATGDARFAEAAVPALLLILVAAVPMAFIGGAEGR